ncbi:MAG: phytanoyl-CoA dioxygenase family protein [Actinomycetota bacterium]
MSTEAPAVITEDQRRTFDSDGVVKIPQAVGPEWIDELLTVVDQEIAQPGPWVTDTNPDAPTDRLFTTRYRWRDDPIRRRFIFQSGVAGLVGQLLASSSVRLYFDHLLIKEPETEAPTPWHQDIPYWPFQGERIASCWVSLTQATVAESSLEFIRGSHRWGNYYAPKSFNPDEEWERGSAGVEVPNVDDDRDAFDIVGFDVEPGDALIFSAWALHGAPGNAGDGRRAAFSTRWLGDDAVWSPHPSSDPIITQDHVSIEPGEYPADDDRFPLVWTAAGADEAAPRTN